MKRRDFLARAGAGTLGLGVLAGGAYVATEGLPTDSGRLPVAVETMDAPGSTAGTLDVPVPGAVTLVDVFATWCKPCSEQMETLAPLHEEYADAGDVRFVSVTNERIGGTLSRADVRDWWRDHDGSWTLGLDPENELLSALGGASVPFLAVATPDGRVAWTHGGVASVNALRDRIEAARE